MKIRAITVQVGKKPRLVEIDNEVLGDYYDLTSGPFFDAVRHPSGATVYLNEDPVGNALRLNQWATDIFDAAGMLATGEGVYGGVVIVGPPDATGSDTDVPEEMCHRLLAGYAATPLITPGHSAAV